MIGIYKITNKITSQSYIGQSVDISRRWTEHCRVSKADKSLISKAIAEYGKDNFIFEVLCECNIDELDKNESYYIHYYNTITPNGYNIENSICGNSRFVKTDVDILSLIKDIKDSNLTLVEIANKYGVSKSTVTRINKGQTHYDEKETYPLRKTRRNTKELKPTREEFKKLIRTYSFCEVGRIIGVSESTIRDWCKTFNLPFHKNEIKTFSDEEWESK